MKIFLIGVAVGVVLIVAMLLYIKFYPPNEPVKRPGDPPESENTFAPEDDERWSK